MAIQLSITSKHAREYRRNAEHVGCVQLGCFSGKTWLERKGYYYASTRQDRKDFGSGSDGDYAIKGMLSQFSGM